MGPYLAQPVTDKIEAQGESLKTKLRYSLCEMQGWRRNMEDAAITDADIGDGNALFAVFDGHGGPEVSKFVEKIFVSLLKSSKLYQEGKYVEALFESFKKVDEKIQSEDGENELKLMRKKNDGSNMGDNRVCDGTGCTANVVLITPQKYIVANAGDSRSVLCRAGRAVPLSIDHKPQSQIEFQRISRAGGKIINGRVNGGLNLSRSFGDFNYKQDKTKSYQQQLIVCHPDVKQYNRTGEDQFLIVGCDGIFQRFLNDNQPLIARITAQKKHGNSNRKIMSSLLDFLLAKDTSEQIGCDNMTCLMVDFM